MAALPASVRLALWATAAYGGETSLPRAVALASPRCDHITGDVSVLKLWRDLGETLVVAALPRAGALTGLPHGNAGFLQAVLQAGECVYAPTLGAALAPSYERYGPVGDRGSAVRWRALECDPVSPGLLETLAAEDVTRRLNHRLEDALDRLRMLDMPLSSGSDGALHRRLTDTDWGLPDGIPEDVTYAMALAVTVAASTETHARADRRRARVVRDLHASAVTALEQASCVASLHLAGFRTAEATA